MPPSNSTPRVPKVGSVAPAVHLPSSTGETVSLSDYLGKTVVLYFYPKADTPGCTKQACGFRDQSAAYEKAKVVVLGISPDPQRAVQKFAEKFHLDFPLLADENHAVAERYGVWGEKTMAGNKYMGVNRTTFIIDPDGTIRHIMQNVKPEGHEMEVMEWLKANKA